MAVAEKKKVVKEEAARAAEASRLSLLISEEVRKKEEMVAERDKKEIELGQNDLVEIVADGEGWKVKMPIRIDSEEKQAIVKLGSSTSGSGEFISSSIFLITVLIC